MSGLASGNGFSVTRTQSFTDIQTNALSADNANVASNERVSNNATDKGSILMGGSDALFNSKALAPLTANGETQNQTLNVTTVTTFQEYSLGTQYKTGKNTYRYASFPTGNEVPPGIILQGPAVANQAIGFLLSANYPSGSTIITFNTAGSIVANAFAGGTMNAEEIVLSGTGAIKDVDGMTYRIISNTSVTGVGEITVVLDPNTPLVEEHAAGDIATLIPNAYSNLIIAPSSTGLTGAIVGVASTFIPNDATNIQYTWIQTSGDTTVKAEVVTFVLGEGAYLVNIDGTTDGHVDLFTGTGVGVTPIQAAHNLLIGTVAGGTFPIGAVGEGLPIRMSNSVIPA